MSSEQKERALSQILQVASAKSARLIMYSTALLGIVALYPSIQLPPEIVAIASGIGVEMIGSLIDKVAKGELSEHEVLEQVEKAVQESKLLTKDDFYHAFDHLRKGQKTISGQSKEIFETLRMLEQRTLQSDSAPLLEVADELLTINVPVGERIYSVSRPLRLSGQTSFHTIGNDAMEATPTPLLYDHKGDVIKAKRTQPAIKYSTRIVNKGGKTAEVYQVFIDYGSRDDSEKRVRLVRMQRAYLAPGDSQKIEFELSQDEMQSTMQDLQVDECVLFLRVICRAGDGIYVTSSRRLGGFRRGENEIEGIAVLSLLHGDALTGPFEEENDKGPLWLEIPMAK